MSTRLPMPMAVSSRQKGQTLSTSPSLPALACTLYEPCSVPAVPLSEQCGADTSTTCHNQPPNPGTSVHSSRPGKPLTTSRATLPRSRCARHPTCWSGPVSTPSPNTRSKSSSPETTPPRQLWTAVLKAWRTCACSGSNVALCTTKIQLQHD